MGDILHPDRGVFQNFGIFQDQLPAHERDIVCGGVMPVGICKAAAVLEMSVFHSKTGSPLIHHFYEFLLASRDMLCHGDAGVVSGGDHNTFDKGFHTLGFPLFQIHLGATHGLGVSACCNRILKRKASLLQAVEYEQERHDLCNACGASSRILLFPADHSSGFRFHQNIGR